MPRPPADARRGRLNWHLRALYLRTICRRKEERKATYVLMYSARGDSYDQGWQNAYKTGLPSVAFFMTLYM